jgi:malate dehydrogenase
MNRKVTVVGGAGNVGMTVARAIRGEGAGRRRHHRHRRAEGGGRRARHLRDVPDHRLRRRVIGGRDWSAAAGSDIVVITSGKPRKPGMSRDDLVRDNFEIMKSIAPNLVQHTPNAVIVPVANPLDAMSQALFR